AGTARLRLKGGPSIEHVHLEHLDGRCEIPDLHFSGSCSAPSVSILHFTTSYSQLPTSFSNSSLQPPRSNSILQPPFTPFSNPNSRTSTLNTPLANLYSRTWVYSRTLTLQFSSIGSLTTDLEHPGPIKHHNLYLFPPQYQNLPNITTMPASMETTVSEPRKPLSFFSLPLELRDKILRSVLIIENNKPSIEPGTFFFDVVFARTISRAIKIGNHQLLKEAQEIFYKENTFFVALPANPPCGCEARAPRHPPYTYTSDPVESKQCTHEPARYLLSPSLCLLMRKIQVRITYNSMIPGNIWMSPLYTLLAHPNFRNIDVLLLSFCHFKAGTPFGCRGPADNRDWEHHLCSAWNHPHRAQMEINGTAPPVQQNAGWNGNGWGQERDYLGEMRRAFLEEVVGSLEGHRLGVKKVGVVGCDEFVTGKIVEAVVLVKEEKAVVESRLVWR
ncbi:hypothetical protein K402DRAFT_252957, partial [Aulographum hederae CBS 113979]